jgi:hypothetical protein
MKSATTSRHVACGGLPSRAETTNVPLIVMSEEVGCYAYTGVEAAGFIEHVV